MDAIILTPIIIKTTSKLMLIVDNTFDAPLFIINKFIANKIKTGCLTSDEAAKSFILRNKKNPYIMKYRDFFTKEVIKAYEFYNID